MVQVTFKAEGQEFTIEDDEICVFDYGYNGNLNKSLRVALTPELLSVSPAAGALAGGNIVTLTGVNLASVISVTFGGVPSPSVVEVGPTELQVEVPSSPSTGQVDITVTTPEGVTTLTDAYFYDGMSDFLLTVNAEVRGWYDFGNASSRAEEIQNRYIHGTGFQNIPVVASVLDRSGNAHDLSASSNRPALIENYHNGRDYLRFEGGNLGAAAVGFGTVNTGFVNATIVSGLRPRGTYERSMWVVARPYATRASPADNIVGYRYPNRFAVGAGSVVEPRLQMRNDARAGLTGYWPRFPYNYDPVLADNAVASEELAIFGAVWKGNGTNTFTVDAYKNGVLQETQSDGISSSINDPYDRLFIGYYSATQPFTGGGTRVPTASDTAFGGYITEIVIIEGALSPAEISGLMSALNEKHAVF